MSEKELPTEPGVYVSDQFPLGTEDDYMPYYLDGKGQWWEFAEPGSGYENYQIDPVVVVYYGPFKKLETR